MNSETFSHLQHNYKNGTATDAEKELFFKLLKDNEQKFIANLDADFLEPNSIQLGSPEVGEFIYQCIAEKIEREPVMPTMSETAGQAPPEIYAAGEQVVHPLGPVRHDDQGKHPTFVDRIRAMRRWVQAAAVTLIILAAGSFFWLQRSSKQVMVQEQPITDIAPGYNKAILTLSDGSTKTLDATGKQVIQQGQTAVSQNGKSLQYNVQGNTAPVSYNTLTTPRGGQFQVQLPDGTKVWLNAVSSIRFPTVFHGAERYVEITGEVYLEVARNKDMPFRVKVNGHTEVLVLGTSFNINAYRDEQTIKTTLLEGLVRVRSGVDSLQLRPGRQVQTLWSGGINKALAIQDMDDVIAWKNGFFSFNNAGLEEVARQLQRWYGIDIKFEGPVPEKIFRGQLDRGVKLSAVLSWLTELGVKNRLDGNVLIISNK